MEKGAQFFYMTSLLALTLTIFLALFKYYERKRKEFKHLAEFFLSILLTVSSAHYFGTAKSPLLVLSVLPWLWVLRTMALICEDISGIPLIKRFHYSSIATGAIFSIALASLGYNLPYILVPYVMSVLLVGGSFLYECLLSQNRKNFGLIHYINFTLFFTFLISRFAFLRGEGPLYDYAFSLLFTTLLFPLYAESIFERQERFLENALYVRNKQLFSHSSFSEFKILSAGVSHEINNALTIINAKIEQMIRKSMNNPDQEKGLRLILHSADRIGKSMRGLREFIYPNEQLEEMRIEDVIQHVLMLYGQRLRNHDVSVRTHGLAGKYVRGHRIQLEQVFLSLLNNSVDTIDKQKEKWIDISCKGDQESVEIVVKDSGRGISEDVETMLSDPFFCTEENVDNGIRLVLAQDILKKHGGNLEYIRSSPNTTFVIDLPAIDYFPEEENRSPLQ